MEIFGDSLIEFQLFGELFSEIGNFRLSRFFLSKCMVVAGFSFFKNL